MARNSLYFQQCGQGHCHYEGGGWILDVGYTQYAALGGGIYGHTDLQSQCVLSYSGIVVICPFFAMNEATICVLMLLDSLNSRGWVSL